MRPPVSDKVDLRQSLNFWRGRDESRVRRGGVLTLVDLSWLVFRVSPFADSGRSFWIL